MKKQDEKKSNIISYIVYTYEYEEPSHIFFYSYVLWLHPTHGKDYESKRKKNL